MRIKEITHIKNVIDLDEPIFSFPVNNYLYAKITWSGECLEMSYNLLTPGTQIGYNTHKTALNGNDSVEWINMSYRYLLETIYFRCSNVTKLIVTDGIKTVQFI